MFRLGHSLAITLPFRWARDHYHPLTPYVIVTATDADTLTVTPAPRRTTAINPPLDPP